MLAVRRRVAADCIACAAENTPENRVSAGEATTPPVYEINSRRCISAA